MKLSEIRKDLPQYDHISDYDLADAIHKKDYPDMDRNEFYSKVGVKTSSFDNLMKAEKVDAALVNATPKQVRDTIDTKQKAIEDKHNKLNQLLGDKPLENPVVSPEFFLGAPVRMGQGLLAKALGEKVVGDAMLKGGAAYGVGSVTGDLGAQAGIEGVDATLTDNFKEQHPDITNAIRMTAALGLGGTLGYKAEMKALNPGQKAKIIEGAKEGKISPEKAQEILSKDEQLANAISDSMEAPKVDVPLAKKDIPPQAVNNVTNDIPITTREQFIQSVTKARGEEEALMNINLIDAKAKTEGITTDDWLTKNGLKIEQHATDGAEFAGKGDSLNQFAGEKAIGADMDALSKAKQMVSDGAPQEQVWKDTGWMLDKDNKWKFEIDDSQATLKHSPDIAMKKSWDDVQKAIDSNEPDHIIDYLKQDLDNAESSTHNRLYSLPQIIDHPKLFEQYPQLKSIGVEFDPKITHSGSYNQDTNIIKLSTSIKDSDLKSTLLHEIQHSIQEKEGFARGGNTDNFQGDYEFIAQDIRDLKKERDIISEGLYNIRKAGYEPSDKELNRYFEIDNKITKLTEKRQVLRKSGRTAFNNYQRLHGEVEARNTESRMDMITSERQASHPHKTMDISVEETNIMFQKLPSETVNALVQFGAKSKDEINTIIRLFKTADVSSIPHELAHVFRRNLSPQELRSAEKAFKVIDGHWTVANEEAFAEGFVKWLSEGKAPTKELESAFKQFQSWLKDLWLTLIKSKEQGFVLTKEHKEFYKAMMGDKVAAKKLFHPKVANARAQRIAMAAEVPVGGSEDMANQNILYQKIVDDSGQPKEVAKVLSDVIKKNIIERGTDAVIKAPFRMVAYAIKKADSLVSTSKMGGLYKDLKAVGNSDTVDWFTGHRIYQKHDYMDMRDHALQSVNRASEKVLRMHSQLAELSDQAREAIYDYMTGYKDQVQLSPELKRLADNMTRTIDDAGQKMVDEGFLSEQAYEDWKGQYLHRRYTSKMKTATDFTKGKGQFNVDTIQERGKRWKGTEDEFYELEQAGLIGKISENKIEADVLPSGEYSFRRDWTREERTAMGEIRDIAYSFPETYARMAQMIEYGKMLKSIPDQYIMLQGSRTDKTMMGLGYTKLEGDRYGALNGQWVDNTIAADIRHTNEDIMGADLNGRMASMREAYKSYVSLWKQSHTVFNTTAHVNNLTSNVVMQFSAGLNPRKAMTYAYDGGVALKKFGVWSKLNARKLTGLTDEEATLLNSIENNTDFKMLLEVQEQGLFGRSQLNDMLNSYMSPSVNMAESVVGKSAKFMQELYEAEDNIMRFAAFKQLREAGMEAADAVKVINRDIIPDYSKPMSEAARKLRGSGLVPFMSWMYYSTPIIVKQMVNNPSRTAALIAGIYAIDKSFGVDPYNEEDMPQDGFATQRMVIGRDGSEVTGLRIQSMIPQSQFADPYETYVRSLATGGIPQTIMAAIGDVNLYYKQPVTTKTGIVGAYHRTKNVVQNIMPTPDVLDKMWNIAETQVMDEKTRKSSAVYMPRSAGQEAASFFLNTLTYDMDKQAQKVQRERDKEDDN